MATQDPFYTPELRAAYLAHHRELDSLEEGDERRSQLRIDFFVNVWKDRTKFAPAEWVEAIRSGK